MRIYTRTGDAGTTGLLGGGRVGKSHPRIVACGEVDELNAVVGWAITAVEDPGIRQLLASLQHDLFALGAILATPAPGDGRRRPSVPAVPRERVESMERWMDEADEELDELREFVLPGGSPGGAGIHLARTVCRRAERAVVALAAEHDVPDGVPTFLNRLSDLLFVMARLENARAGYPDVVWRKDGAPDGDEGGLADGP